VSAGPARVLAALRHAEGGVCSGETLSARHGISRAQVWKDVEALRERGYAIEGAPGGGYRLTAVPDRLYPEEIHEGLATRWLARDLRWFDAADSTNRVALEWARAGAVHGATVVAESQSAGRGRLGRSFFSPAYLNLYSSSVLRPTSSTAEAPAWILAAAVGVADAVARTVPDPGDVEIKWPNDVLLGGRKTCGILMEMGAEAARVQHLVMGIGVNLNVPREDFPDEFRAQATSLASHVGRRVDRVAFARDLYACLEDVLDGIAAGGFDAVRPRFEARFRMTGRRVRVLETGGGGFEGCVLGIDGDGALRLERADGTAQRVVAGDVTLAKEAQ
jgi:BirA family biotin operon repressor/biotin-[acetyl-CoA-carboxylase] ligase